MTIRRIRPGDWPALHDIRLRALTGDPDAFGSSLQFEQSKDDAWWKEWAEEGARSDDWATFVAEEDDRWIGLVGCFREEDDPHAAKIFSMWVEPHARRRGVARALLEVAEQWLVERGVREIRLSVSNVNDAARTLYARQGYTPTGDTRPLASNPEFTEVDMKRIV